MGYGPYGLPDLVLFLFVVANIFVNHRQYRNTITVKTIYPFPRICWPIIIKIIPQSNSGIAIPRSCILFRNYVIVISVSNFNPYFNFFASITRKYMYLQL